LGQLAVGICALRPGEFCFEPVFSIKCILQIICKHPAADLKASFGGVRSNFGHAYVKGMF
jgi:hypothetical protein